MVTYTTPHGLALQELGENRGAWQVLLNSTLEAINDRLPRSYAGDPNGVVAGLFVGQLIYDSTNDAYYKCTTAGDAATAVWTSIAPVGTVKVSADDTTPSNLESKIIAGEYIELTTQNGGGNETRTIAVTGLHDVNALGSIGGGAQTIDLELGRTVTGTIDTSATTFTFSNAHAGSDAFDIYLTNGGSQTINWPVNVKWTGGDAPTLTTAGIDHLVFTTPDGGTTWYGYVAGLDMQ